eukprot:scaffold15407_cov58-Attheya_sp.AAC.4
MAFFDLAGNNNFSGFGLGFNIVTNDINLIHESSFGLRTGAVFLADGEEGAPSAGRRAGTKRY